MSKTRHRIFAIAAWTALAATANAQEIEAYIPAIALPPEPMGNIPPIPTVSNSTATAAVSAATNNLEPIVYSPAQVSKPTPSPAPTVPPSTAPLSAPFPAATAPPITVSGQRWRWYGYGTINGRAAAGPGVFAGTVMGPTGMSAAVDAPSPVPPAATTTNSAAPTTAVPASIGIPQPMSSAPVLAPATHPSPVTVDGPAIPQVAPEVPPAIVPSNDLPIPAPPVEPWSGPLSKSAIGSWQPVIARASSQR